jgi:hypothetical protein
MNGKKLLMLYGGLAVASTVSTWVVYAQLHQTREAPAFSYDMEFYEHDENGARKHTHTNRYAVRSDGSTAIVDDALLAITGERRVIVRDYTKGEAWVTSMVGRTVTTLPLADGAVPPVHYQRCDEGEASTLGRYEIRRERRVVRDPETDQLFFIVDRWRAPELGCATLRTMRYDENEKLTHDRVTTNIVIGEPDATLFQVPTGYVESSPKEAQQRLVDLGHAPPVRGDQAGLLDRAERRYRDAR